MYQIYSKWIEYNEYKQTRTGTVVSENQNSRKASEYEWKRLSYRTWNDYVNRYNDTYVFMYTNESDYNEVHVYHTFLNRKGLMTKGNIT